MDESGERGGLLTGGRWGLVLRVAITILAVALWFWTQALIGARGLPAGCIGDRLHDLTAGINAYLHQVPAAANALLIASSAVVDLLALFLLGSWVFAGRVRPFLGLVLLLALRQTMQALCALPTPANMIWHYPGFPSLLVTYNVANDYFFSGHTGIAVLGALELARLGRPRLTVLGLTVAVFEIAAVLVLRAHYTMDVFAGLVAALWVAHASDWLVQRFSQGPKTADGVAGAP